ncbi:MAG TPA: glycosyltransferase family 9 protein [Stellaceae bacterium]|nr:glycosyltransferase family 9 protein [Stellaceae bacterium]
MSKVERVLIYRLGSIGDFVIALPCLNLVRRRFPAARIALLTNLPVEARAAPAMSVLEGSGLVDVLLTYAGGTRDPRELLGMRREIRAMAPDLMVYLASRRALWQVLRDHAYFASCGIERMVGFPYVTANRLARPPEMEGGHWGHEAQRLARCLAPLGDAASYERASWDLGLTAAERSAAQRLIGELLPERGSLRPAIGLSVGTKQTVKDWGDENWRGVLRRLADAERPLLLIGSREERERSQAAAAAWPGPVLNFCGAASPRVSAALLELVELFLCHDSGPMHLAAAVGTRIIAVFSRHRPPGQWFPFGLGHRVFYPMERGQTILDISPESVADAALETLARTPPQLYKQATG